MVAKVEEKEEKEEEEEEEEEKEEEEEEEEEEEVEREEEKDGRGGIFVVGEEIYYVAVLCRNLKIISLCIFQSHCCIWSNVSLNFR